MKEWRIRINIHVYLQKLLKRVSLTFLRYISFKDIHSECLQIFVVYDIASTISPTLNYATQYNTYLE